MGRRFMSHSQNEKEKTNKTSTEKIKSLELSLEEKTHKMEIESKSNEQSFSKMYSTTFLMNLKINSTNSQ